MVDQTRFVYYDNSEGPVKFIHQSSGAPMNSQYGSFLFWRFDPINVVQTPEVVSSAAIASYQQNAGEPLARAVSREEFDSQLQEELDVVVDDEDELYQYVELLNYEREKRGQEPLTIANMAEAKAALKELDTAEPEGAMHDDELLCYKCSQEIDPDVVVTLCFEDIDEEHPNRVWVKNNSCPIQLGLCCMEETLQESYHFCNTGPIYKDPVTLVIPGVEDDEQYRGCIETMYTLQEGCDELRVKTCEDLVKFYENEYPSDDEYFDCASIFVESIIL